MARMVAAFASASPPEVVTKWKPDAVYPCFLDLKGKTYAKERIECAWVLVGFRLKADDAASSAAGALTNLATGSA